MPYSKRMNFTTDFMNIRSNLVFNQRKIHFVFYILKVIFTFVEISSSGCDEKKRVQHLIAAKL